MLVKSSLGIKYPTNRDHSLHSGYQWLRGRQIDDGAEGLWRINDGIYNFQDFVKNHPGGETWLKITKGTDITEAFYVHHIKGIPKDFLQKFFIRKASTPRNYPFTFHEDGFYNTLRQRVANKLSELPKTPVLITKLYSDFLLLSYILVSIFAVVFRSFALGALAGLILSSLGIAAHNFFHTRDNFRMYYFDFTLMQSWEWRVSHSLSHHLYTNTVTDMEISSIEPYLQHLPHGKNIVFRYLSWVYYPGVCALLFIGHHIKSLIQLLILGEKIRFEIFLGYSIPLLMCLVSQENVFYCLLMYLWSVVIASTHFGLVGLNVGHHHPDIFHDGDAYREKDDMDWGIYQLHVVTDRDIVTGSHFIVLTNFGDHVLHHLFPTLDHGLLEPLYPIFWETCKDFGVEHRVSTTVDLIKGHWKQLARTEPKKIAPKPSKKQLIKH